MSERRQVSSIRPTPAFTWERRLRALVAVAFGANPWPTAGGWGYAAMAIMALPVMVALATLALVAAQGTARHGFFGVDFIAYATGATMLLNGEAHQLYVPARQLEVQRELLAAADGGSLPNLSAFVNPPHWALLVAPFALVGLLAGMWLWWGVNLAASAWVLLRIAAQGVQRPGWKRATILLLCFFPFFQAVHFGQMAALMLAAFGGWFGLARTNHPFAAGAVLSLALVKPQYVPLMLLFLAWKGQWKQLLGFAVGAVPQAVLSLAMLFSGGEPPVQTFRQFMAFDGSQTSAIVDRHLTLRAIILHVLPNVQPALQFALLATLTVAATVAFLWAVGRRWDPWGPGFAWQTLALFAIVPLTAFHNNLLHLYLLLPPLVALLVDPATLRPFTGGEHHERNEVGVAGWSGPALAGLLTLPSLGFILGVDFAVFYAAGWLTALGGVALGLAGYWRWRSSDPAPSPGATDAAATLPSTATPPMPAPAYETADERR